MFAKTAIALVLLVGTASNVPAAPKTYNPAHDVFDLRALTDRGLFAEEYDAILEAAQHDPQLREKIIERIMDVAK
jgi:hypothetical protein